jgi:indolepyruvate ferredoxin oxidoreductase beta subunit
MKYDIVFAGVGGQGVLSMAALIGRAAVIERLNAKQSEVHGMAQRGGAVQAHLRLSDQPIESDLVPLGTADLVLSLEPVEALRYLPSLAPSGTLITATNAIVNIPNYPDLEQVLNRIKSLPRAVVVDAERLAEEAGDPLTINTVMVGAAAEFLPLRLESLEQAIEQTFGAKEPRTLEANRKAFHAGQAVPR